MHRQSSAGLTSKWELVHYGSAARYFTSDLEIGKDEKVNVIDYDNCLAGSVSFVSD